MKTFRSRIPAAFEPPSHRSGMRALLDHSRQTYGPLPSELRRIRSRTSSRPSPYPQPQRAVRISSVRLDNPTIQTPAVSAPSTVPALIPQVLQQRPANPNAVVAEVSPLVTGKVKVDSGSFSQSRIDFDVRRNTPGRAKRGVGKENKENTASPGAMTAYVSILS
jgi:serine/arginine repetitive matrix protein 2